MKTRSVGLGAILLVLAASSAHALRSDRFELNRRLDVAEIALRIGTVHALGGSGGLAFAYVADRGGIWYSAAWLPDSGSFADWGHDTLEVVLPGGQTVPVLEQFAMTEPIDVRPIPLVGRVMLGDLYRRPFQSLGPAIVVWLRLPQELELKRAVTLRVRSGPPPLTTR